MHVFISPRVYTCLASLTPGIWSGIPRRWCAYISLLSVYIYMRALHRVKRCLGADKRNPHRHGGAFIKGSMASVPPRSPLWVAQQAWPIYLYQGQGGGSGRRREDRSGGGEAAWAGPVTHARGDGWGKPQGDSAQSQTGWPPRHLCMRQILSSQTLCVLARLCMCVCKESLWVCM